LIRYRKGTLVFALMTEIANMHVLVLQVLVACISKGEWPNKTICVWLCLFDFVSVFPEVNQACPLCFRLRQLKTTISFQGQLAATMPHPCCCFHPLCRSLRLLAAGLADVLGINGR
jgi:hypothetical protein